MKKSQMEIMGLAIIVILISLIIIFAVRFIIFQKPAEYKKEFTSIELASNVINALLLTTNPECSDLSFTELFQDCAEGSSINCNKIASCDFVRDKTGLILNQTLGQWHISYEFHAYASTGTLFKSGKCAGNKRSKSFPIPTSPQTLNLTLTLDIC